MASVILAQTRFARVSGLPEDDVINTTHWIHTGPTVTAGVLDAIRDKILGFYNTPFSSGGTVLATRLSEVLSLSGHTIKLYDLSDPIPRQPVRVETFGLGGMQPGLPSEVALVVSLRASVPSGQPPGRYRGRFYVGPLAVATMANSSPSVADVRASSTFVTLLANLGQRLAEPATVAGETVQLCVYSPSSGEANSVSQVIVDDAYDTQRSRGADASLRVIRDVV
jgi:hypothetical protein